MTTNQERAEELMANARNVVSFKQLAQALADAGLIAPDLLTLAELIEQGNDPAQYQWMQAKIFEHASTIGIITCIDRYQNHSTVLFSDGVARLVDNYQITPLPDEPKLEWPSLVVSGESESLSVETEESEAKPRPEDVPEGEVWMIRYHENADPVPAFRVHASKYGPGKRWAHYRVGGSMLGFADDEHVTLISRLVPEVQA